MVCGKKGQASFEFLGTYVWAIFALIVVFSGLYFFGVFDVGDNIPDSCSLGEGIACPDVAMERVDSQTYLVDLGLVNTNDERIGIQSIKIRKKGSTDYCVSSDIFSRSGGTINTNISSLGSRKEMSFVIQNGVRCDFLTSGIELSPDVREQFDMVLVYTKGRSNLPVTSSGNIFATLKGNETTFSAAPGCVQSSSYCGYSKCGSDAPGYTENYGVDCYTNTCNGISCTVPNHVPYFSGLTTSYTYPEKTGLVGIGDLVNFGVDDDGPNPLTYTLENLPVTPDIIDCSLAGTVLSCIINNTGTETFNVTVDDGLDNHSETITITVTDLVNNPPKWLPNLTTTYEYNQTSVSETLIANMTLYSSDADGDSLTYYVNLTETNSSVISCYVSSISTLICGINDYGGTSFGLIVSDGEANDTATIDVAVIDLTTNQAPKFTSNLTESYSYDISLSNVNVVDLAQYSEDYEGDTMYYYLDDSGTGSEISCSLTGSILRCTLNSVGSTALRVIVGDDWQNSTPKRLEINVTDSTPINTAPYFTDLIAYHEAVYDDSFHNVVDDLSAHATDDEGDSLIFYLDESGTNLSIIDCDVVLGSILRCVYNGEGTTLIGIIVGDGMDNSSTHEMRINLTSFIAGGCEAEPSCCLGQGGFSPDRGITCFFDSGCTDSVCIYSQTVNFNQRTNFISVPVNDSNTLFTALESQCSAGNLLDLSDDEGNRMYYDSGARNCVNLGIGEEELLQAYVAIVQNTFSYNFKGAALTTPTSVRLNPGQANLVSIPLTARTITVDEIFNSYLGAGLINITNDNGRYYKESTFLRGVPDDQIGDFVTGEGYMIYVDRTIDLDMRSYIN